MNTFVTLSKSHISFQMQDCTRCVEAGIGYEDKNVVIECSFYERLSV